MKALVYSAANSVSIQQKPDPEILLPSDAIVKLTKTTICGTDLHILKGDVATCQPGRILGHEGIGVVSSTGSSVSRFSPGDRVLISCISSCAACEYCRRGMYSHCTTGGWILGNSIDGTQAQYARIPHADSSLYKIPAGVDDAAMVMLSDIFPTGLECGVQNGRVQPGSTVAVVGAGPVGLAALMTAQMYSPSKIIVLDIDDKRLETARELGATTTVNNKAEDAVARVKQLTDGKGCDAVIEAVGVPATFALCQELLAPGGVLANVGVHGSKADLFLDRLWDKNISITTRLVDTVSTPMLLRMVESGKLRAARLVTHRFKFDQMEEAYKTFGQAGQTGALKVLIDME
ncbi:zinc-binding dehydrogenase domain protein [Metarhizium robertsii]|uniref:Alcohol dehydrogenase GroES domain-containing protein n=2 Tax=Metarhizium robertsii TaxID=568076 RepID=E9EVF8_METRA|nr:alcohol dehydrogenase GroES domain-containing protein [Metarhizium robertsii ARSEF 23]EFZ00230.2 alcohol dehydrogenase GroES domain-containing protein [Metarhizium robertsii ARSEF 23]EXV02690.1 zinc-binding dehydrogenase domain protein [Metarhizium robertsii]